MNSRCSSGWTGSACATRKSFMSSTANDLQWHIDGLTFFVAICSPSCMNGFCSAPGLCTCHSGWNGSVCSDGLCRQNLRPVWLSSLMKTLLVAICSPACQNSGVCSAPNVCNCSSGYNGASCTYPVCSAACQNGGSCVSWLIWRRHDWSTHDLDCTIRVSMHIELYGFHMWLTCMLISLSQRRNVQQSGNMVSSL